MFNLIPISLLIGALGGILYIVSNHLSELNNNNEENKNDFSGFNLKARFAQWTSQLPLDNIKSQSLSLTQKLLHRFRLALLKTDNHLMKLIGKISQRDKILNGDDSGEKSEAAPDFWRDFSDSKQEKEEVIPKPVSEVKIEFASEKDKQIEKFFDPVRNSAKKVDGILTNGVSNGVDIKPAKISSEISEGKPAKKTLKIKKSSK